MVVDPAAEQEQIDRLNAWRRSVTPLRSTRRWQTCGGCPGRPQHHASSIAAAKAGVTTGEWAARDARCRTANTADPPAFRKSVSNRTEGLEDIRDAVNAVSDRLGRRLRFLVGKPGLDGHSNGAEQIAFRARDCGMDIDYEGIRLTPEEIVARRGKRSACDRAFHPLGEPHPAGRGYDAAPERRGLGPYSGSRRRHHSRTRMRSGFAKWEFPWSIRRRISN